MHMEDSASNEKTDARIPQDEIGSVYDGVAWIYDAWAYLTESRARARALELAAIRDGQDILEAAVGTGVAFYAMAERNPSGSNTGIDLSEGMLNKAKRRLANLPHDNYALSPGSAFELDIADESVDLVMNNYMFDLVSFDEMDRVIGEFRRVLRKGGKLVLVNMTQGERFGSGIYASIYKLSPRAMGGCRGVQMAGRLEQHGFSVERREYLQQMLFPSEVILALK
jgi:ubiquinone/menaquinone biosynthesis C-methylase UbiE